MAQIGNSCSNPYLMNLSAGAGDQVFNLNSNDTIFFIKLVGFANKTHLKIEFDTLALNYYLEELRVTNANCSNQLTIMQKKYFGRFQTFESSVNSLGADTVLLALSIGKFTDTLSYQNTINIHIRFKNIYIQSSAPCINPVECNNLLPNGSFEEFSPPSSSFNTINELDPFFSSYLCSWDDEEETADYFSPWFNGGCYQFGPQNICNSQGLNPNLINSPLACGYPAHGSDFFANSESYSALQFGDNGASVGGYESEILKGELTVPLIAGKKYFFEVDIAKPKRLEYGGQLDFDLTDNSNFIQNNYITQTPITLSVDPFDYDINLNWRRENTIYLSMNGGEKYLYIGNLRLSPINAMPSASGFPICSQFGGAVYYLFDNIVVKEFFADAGDPDITICSGTEIGGNTCAFPNGTYEWLPANLFVNNTLYHPTFIGTSNATVSLTVSILMSDGTTQVSDPSFVNVAVGGPTITINGSTSIVVGNNTTLTASGAATYTWYDGQNNVLSISDTYITPNLTQTATYTVVGFDANGCSMTETITVIVTQLPAACISDPNYPNTIIIPDGTNAVDFLALIPNANINPISANGYQISQVNFFLAGQLIIDNNTEIDFLNCHFACYDGAQIRILMGSDLFFRVCTLETCNNVLWRGIRNEGALTLSSCLVKNAHNGVSILPLTKNIISNTKFTDNYVGINIAGECIYVNSANTFSNPNTLHPGWNGTLYSKAICGMRIFNALTIEIDHLPNGTNLFTTFKDINCGIVCDKTNLRVNNAYFENISNQFGVNNFVNGRAIYATGTSANTLRVLPKNGINQSITFKNCDLGIYHKGINTRLDNLGMEEVNRGIVGEKLAFCTNRMEYNNINASIYGIEMKLIDDVDLFVINHNTITMNDEEARGIAVSAFSNNSSAGSNIKIQGNTIDITNGVYGIEVNNVFHPKININQIFHSSNTMVGVVNYWSGIRTTDCLGSDVSCNELLVGTGLANSNSGADIYVSQSQNSLIACNTTNGLSPTGIFLSSDNNASSIQTNEIGSHGIGLYLDNSCVVGPQPAPGGQAHGNRWNGSYGSNQNNIAAAVNENIWDNIPGQPPVLGWATIVLNRFRIDETQNTYPFYPENFPDNIYNYNSDPTDNTDWFVEDNLFPRLDYCSGGYCPAPFEDNWDDDKKEMSSIDGAIALGLIQTAGYPEETKWMLKKGLISSLTRNDSLLNANDTMQVFYFNIDQENLKKLQLISDTMMAVKLFNQAFISVMQLNDSIMNDLSMAIRNLMPLMEDSTFQDSITIVIETLKNQYSIIADINETLSTQLNNQKNLAGQQSLNINTGIVPNNFNEYLERQVNDIYLRTFGQGLDTLTVSDIATLSYISHICPQAVGPSIYKARALYQMVNDTVIYNDSVVCRNVGFFRESQELLMPNLIEKVKSNNFMVYPNPGKERLKMIITGYSEEGIVSVYNAMGALIESLAIAKESNSKELDISAWAEGYYLIKYQTNNYQSQIKFIKVK